MNVSANYKHCQELLLMEEKFTYSTNENRTTNYVIDAVGNRLTKTAEYQYNENNIRTSQKIDGVETKFLLDSNRDYAQVLEEYNNSGVRVSYVYGLDLISQNRSGVTSFYLYDGLGSVRALSDRGGFVSDRYIYDAYGNTLSSTGTTVNKYLFTGEQFDSSLGQYYLRDRYYDPRLGRFSIGDRYEGRLDEPLSLHKYIYTHNNPFNGVDPSGKFSLLEVAAISSITAFLSGVSFGFGIQSGRFINSKYTYRSATEYEKEHREEALNITEFLDFLDGKGIEGLEGEDTFTQFYFISYQVKGGPGKEFRYVEDPQDAERAIDIVHFTNFGRGLGIYLGWPNEFRQGSGDSAWILEDLRSNYFGEVFFKEYFNPTESLRSSFEKFYMDLTNDAIKFPYVN